MSYTISRRQVCCAITNPPFTAPIEVSFYTHEEHSNAGAYFHMTANQTQPGNVVPVGGGSAIRLTEVVLKFPITRVVRRPNGDMILFNGTHTRGLVHPLSDSWIIVYVLFAADGYRNISRFASENSDFDSPAKILVDWIKPACDTPFFRGHDEWVGAFILNRTSPTAQHFQE